MKEQKISLDLVIIYLENIKLCLGNNYDFDKVSIKTIILHDLIEICTLLNSIKYNNTEKIEMNTQAFYLLKENDLDKVYTQGVFEGGNLDDLYDKVSDFLIKIKQEIHVLSFHVLTNFRDKLEIVLKLESDQVKKHLCLAEEIYVKKLEQDELDKKSYELEISNKLKDMKESADNKVKHHTIGVFLLFSLLFVIPVLLNYLGVYDLLNGIISDYVLYALIYIPIMSFIWYFIQQRSYAVKIATDYQFKLNLFNVFLYSHNWVNAKIEDETTKKSTYEKLVDNLLSTLADNPTRLYDKEPKGLPIDEVVSLVKEITRK